MDADEKRTLIDRYIAAYNDFDVDGMLASLHPDVEFRNISGGEVNASASGAEEFRRLAEQSKGLFSSRRQEITRFESDGNTAAVDISYEGVLASDLPNGMNAGDMLRLEGRSEFGFRDSKIHRITDYS
jgi:ketosteroid isomerase-like protein